MLKRIVMVGLTVSVLLLISNSALAWGVTCPDPSVPGTWTIVQGFESRCDFGVILYSEAVLLQLSDGTQVFVTDHPESWDYFYGDFFIFEKPDYGDFEEEGTSEESQPLPAGTILAFNFWIN